jgi:hypothetical protein
LQRYNTDTVDTFASSITWGSSILGKSIGFLKILKEAAEIAPVPFLKGTIGTALALLEMSQVSFTVNSLRWPDMTFNRISSRPLEETARIWSAYLVWQVTL